MRKSQLVAGVLISLVTVSMLSGCASVKEPDKAPEEVIKDGMVGWTDLTSYKYDVMFKGDVKDEENVKFDFKLNGAVDLKDSKDPKFTMKINGSASDGAGMGGSGVAELRMNKDAVYVIVNSLKIDGEELPAEAVEMFGKWWMVEIPKEIMAEVTNSLDTAGGFDKEEAKASLADTKVFATAKFVGADDIMGEQSYHYSLTLDKAALIALAKETAESQGETLTAAEIAEMEADVEKVDAKGDVWIGTKSNVVTQLSGSIVFEGGEGEASGTMELKVTLGDINKPVTVEVPSGAEAFPIESLLGPMMMMGGMADPSLMMEDSALTDDSMMFDESALDGATFDESMMEEFDEAAFDEAMAELDSL